MRGIFSDIKLIKLGILSYKDIRKNHEHDVESVLDNKSAIDYLLNAFNIMAGPGDTIDKSLEAI